MKMPWYMWLCWIGLILGIIMRVIAKMGAHYDWRTPFEWWRDYKTIRRIKAWHKVHGGKFISGKRFKIDIED